MYPDQTWEREDADCEATKREKDDKGEAHEDAMGYVHAGLQGFLLGGYRVFLGVHE